MGKEGKLSVFADDMILHMKKTQKTQPKFLDITTTFSK
jgi:hypothetical protein